MQCKKSSPDFITSSPDVMCAYQLNQLCIIICDCLSKSRYVCTQTEIHFISLAYRTLNNYACLLPPLANVDWSAFSE